MLVAAAGNFGPNSPPQYPAADPNVIAVTATDADDRLFMASNIGNHVAIAAPGVDILLPDPGASYQLRSGTSFAAAHVSGIAALILARKPSLSPDLVRQILMATARDLGAPGKDPQFGAGLADAYQAILALDSQIVTAPAATAHLGLALSRNNLRNVMPRDQRGMIVLCRALRRRAVCQAAKISGPRLNLSRAGATNTHQGLKGPVTGLRARKQQERTRKGKKQQ